MERKGVGLLRSELRGRGRIGCTGRRDGGRQDESGGLMPKVKDGCPKTARRYR
jgi:hypothetical protein